MALMGAFAQTGYFFPMIKIFETLTGVLLLANLFVPFALVMIFPIMVGILTIHLFLDPSGLAVILLLMVMHGFLVWGYLDFFKSALVIKARLK